MKKQLKEVSQQVLVFNKVLITGIDGFTGIHLERLLLEKGYDVFGTVIQNKNNKHHFVCDIRKQEEIINVIESVKPDYIFHFAGISFVGEQNRSVIYDVNVIGTENLLKAIIKCKLKPRKVIIPSSATVYGNQNNSILDETMCPKPTNHYGYSKLILEQMCSTFFSSINIIITRPFNYTGPYQTENFLIPKIISHYKKKENTIELGNVNIAREFNHVSDIANIYLLLMLSKTNSIVVNICSGNAIYLLDIIDILNRFVGNKIEIVIKKELVRSNEINILKGSTNRLKSLINYNFEKNIENTLIEMFKHDFYN